MGDVLTRYKVEAGDNKTCLLTRGDDSLAGDGEAERYSLDELGLVVASNTIAGGMGADAVIKSVVRSE